MAGVSTPEIDVDQFAAARTRGVVVDVRERAECVGGQALAAVPVPTEQLPSRLDELDRENPAMSSAPREPQQRDDRSAAVGRLVAGETTAWVESGRPIEEAV